jgi:hypothetical protein
VKRSSLLLVAVAVASAVGALGATARADSFDPVVVGARAAGMGGAAIAAAADLEAVSANPAGLLALKKGELLLGGRRLADTAAAQPASGPATETTDRHSAITLAGGALPLRLAGHELVLAVAYQRPLELVTHYRERPIDGGVIAWSPAVAVALTPWLGAGAALNLWDGTRDFDHDLADGSHLTWQSDYSGTNATLGLLLDLGRTAAALPVRVGLAAHTPFDLGIDYRERARSASGVESDATWTYRVQMPWMAGLGISWEPLADLTVALEGETRLFSGKKTVATGSTGTDTTPLSASDDNVTPLRLGAEYRVRVGALTIPVRAGVSTVPTLYADRRDGQPAGQASGMAYSGGIGVAAGRLRADLAYRWSRYERDTIVGADTTTATRTYQTWVLQLAVAL